MPLLTRIILFPADPVAAQHAPPTAQKRTPAPSIESLRSSDAVGQRGQRPFSRPSSSVKSSTSALASSSRDTSRPPSTVENHLDYLREPVVKTPTEPTRVKSPEGSVRSPDPINWTVPLDTGKTFSVTQSLKDGGTDPNDARTELTVMRPAKQFLPHIPQHICSSSLSCPARIGPRQPDERPFVALRQRLRDSHPPRAQFTRFERRARRRRRPHPSGAAPSAGREDVLARQGRQGVRTWADEGLDPHQTGRALIGGILLHCP